MPLPHQQPAAADTGMLPALEQSENEQKVHGVLGEEELSIHDMVRHYGLPASLCPA